MRAAPLAGVVTWGSAGFTVPAGAQSGVKSIAGCEEHWLALRDDGSVVAWGFDTTVPAEAKEGIVAIAAGSFHSLALTSAGAVVAWGRNDAGQATVPEAAKSRVIAIAAGGAHSLALRDDGSVVAWGSNSVGQSSVPDAALHNIKAIAAGFAFCLAVTDAGGVIAWGQNNVHQCDVPAEAQGGVSTVAAGFAHALALRGDGSVVTWGATALGLGVVPAPATDGVVAIAAGKQTSLALKADGSIVGWGDNSADQTAVPADLPHPVLAVAGASRSTAAIVTWKPPVIVNGPVSQTVDEGASLVFSVEASGDRLAYQWQKDGRNLFDATGPTYAIGYAIAQDSGNYSVIVSNMIGRVTNAPPAVLQVKVKPVLNPVVTKGPGDQRVAAGAPVVMSVTATGPDLKYQWFHNSVSIPGATNASLPLDAALFADAGSYTVDIGNSYGTASASGQLTVVPPADSGGVADPRGVLLISGRALTGVTQVVEGTGFCAVRRADGSVDWWEKKTTQFLARRDIPDSGRRGVMQISAGADLCHFLRDDGSVVAWKIGYAANPFGPFNLPAPVPEAASSQVVAIQQSGAHVAALKRDGLVVEWGVGDGTVPDTARSGVVGIAVGPTFAAALKGDGSVVAWRAGGVLLDAASTALSGAVRVATEATSICAQRADGSWAVWDLDGTVSSIPAPAGIALVSGSPSFALGSDRIGYRWNGSGWVRDDATAWASGYLLARSESLIVAVPRPPIVVEPLAGKTVEELTFTEIRVLGGGVGATYQWLKDGVQVSGATGAVLNLGRASVAQSGSYTVTINSSLGLVTSSPAVLSVTPVSIPDSGVVLEAGRLPREFQTGVKQLVVGRAHVVVLRRDGSVAVWGLDAFGSVEGTTRVPTDALSGVVEVTATYSGCLALKSDGSVLCWGTGGPWRTPPSTIRSLVGGAGIFAIDANGGVLRRDASNSVFNADGIPAAARSEVVALAGWQGTNLPIALKRDGTVVPLDSHPVPPEVQSDVVAISSGMSQPKYKAYNVATKRDGSVFEWDEQSARQVPGVSVPGVRFISSTGFRSAGLKANGFAETWGSTVTIPDAWQGRILAIQGVQAYDTFAALLSPAPLGLAPQSIDFAAISDFEFTRHSVILEARASSGYPVSFQLISGPASLNGNELSLQGVGTVVVRAVQAGDGVVFGPGSATQSFQVLRAHQHIEMPALPNRVYTEDFIPLTSYSDGFLPLDIVVSGPASRYNSALKLEGAGVVTVTATQAGDANYFPAEPVVRTFTVDRAPQTVSMVPIPTQGSGVGTIDLAASASSKLPVQFAVRSGPATVSGNRLTITGVGTVVVEATQAGDLRYLPGTSTQSFQVVGTPQILTVTPPATRSYTPNEVVTLVGSASSGLSVSWTLDGGPGSLVGNQLTILGAGTFRLTARQPGNDTVSPANPVSVEFAVTKASQTLTFELSQTGNYATGVTLPLVATASSGLPVAFTITDGPASITQETLSITGAGSVTVMAIQAGDANYQPVSVSRTITSLPKGATISVIPVAPRRFLPNLEIPLTATVSSGAPVRFHLESGPGALTGNRLLVQGAGVFRVTVSEDAAAGVPPADPVVLQFEVVAADQSIEWAELVQPTLGGRPIPLQAESGSGLPVQFTILDGPGVLGPEGLQATDLGVIRVAADQPGNTNYRAAERRIQTVSPRPGMDLIFPPPGAAALPALKIVLPEGRIAVLERADSLGAWSSMGPVIGLGAGNPVYLPVAAPQEGGAVVFWRVRVQE